MNAFEYSRAADVSQAVELASRAHARFLGGGTNLVDLMRESIEQPELLIDVTGLSQRIELQDDGSVLIGAATKNTALACAALIRERYPLLSRALLAGASAQIRNMATVAGNILQRTRCVYFYDDSSRCNKRDPGRGCDALEGFNRYHAVLGTSPTCIATHPSDMCVALAALDAVVHVTGSRGSRAIELTEFHQLPGDTPHIETQLEPGELITAVTLPPLRFARHSTYRKVRDRASYAFALISVAAALELNADGTISDVRVALGGVAHKPWRAWKVEEALKGARAKEAVFQAAAAEEFRHAKGRHGNAFKIELAQRTIVACLKELAEGARP
ncbi:MAG TPA: xanthine dehydrogenase family protein subunit M [Steroidobacter sp.]|uniref:FAD binding domain-containing protein n=1 Tax=Steroidobacter sp. TaxID=1978227 RepID=UPI002ED9A7A4